MDRCTFGFQSSDRPGASHPTHYRPSYRLCLQNSILHAACLLAHILHPLVLSEKDSSDV